VLSVVLPGDIADVPGCFFENALYSVRTPADLRTSAVPFARIMSLFHTHPHSRRNSSGRSHAKRRNWLT